MAETVLARRQFDAAAADYDAVFSSTHIGRQLREAVWRRIAPLVGPDMRVLDLGCGTGEDAIWFARQGCRVLAADGAPAMLRIVAEKAARLGLSDRVETLELDLNSGAERARLGEHFDVILSNFGALNCVCDPAALGRDLARWTKPGGFVALNVMGRFCAWEFVWYLMRLRPAALRRAFGLATARVGGERISVYYWGVGQLKRMLGASFDLRTVTGIGVALPPSYLFALLDRHPRLTVWLARLEAHLSDNPLFARMADHTLLILSRLP